jgi:hypothetical protein
VAEPPAAGKTNVHPPEQQQETGQSVRAANVNSQPLDNMLRAVTLVQQFMTDFNGAVSEEDKLMVITKLY